MICGDGACPCLGGAAGADVNQDSDALWRPIRNNAVLSWRKRQPGIFDIRASAIIEVESHLEWPSWRSKMEMTVDSAASEGSE